MLTLEEAWSKLDAAIHPLPSETVAIEDAAGRVLAAAAESAVALPPFDQSSLDGYAVRASEMASGDWLPVSGITAAGRVDARPTLPAGSVWRVFTGALVPQGADAVVAQEHTESGPQGVRALRPIKAGQALRLAGEEMPAGTRLAEAGQRLTPALAAALATAGVATVSVRRRPRVAVLVTGDEVVKPADTLALGQVHDANSVLLRHWLAAQGCELLFLIAVADTPAAVAAALARAYAEADLVLTTGGVSVGDHDHIPAVSRQLGAEEVFWKVAQKPGKPLYCARKGHSLLLGLPGNPASVLVNLIAFAHRALARLQQRSEQDLAWRSGLLAHPVMADAERGSWLRVAVLEKGDGAIHLMPLRGQASHMLGNSHSLAGLAWLPAGQELVAAGGRIGWLPVT